MAPSCGETKYLSNRPRTCGEITRQNCLNIHLRLTKCVVRVRSSYWHAKQITVFTKEAPIQFPSIARGRGRRPSTSCSSLITSHSWRETLTHFPSAPTHGRPFRSTYSSPSTHPPHATKLHSHSGIRANGEQCRLVSVSVRWLLIATAGERHETRWGRGEEDARAILVSGPDFIAVRWPKDGTMATRKQDMWRRDPEQSFRVRGRGCCEDVPECLSLMMRKFQSMEKRRTSVCITCEDSSWWRSVKSLLAHHVRAPTGVEEEGVHLHTKRKQNINGDQICRRLQVDVKITQTMNKIRKLKTWHFYD